jgi:anti-sigma factor RsiW
VQFALAMMMLFAVGIGGHQWGKMSSGEVLPVQSIIDDFDAGLRDPSPFEIATDNPAETATWLTRKLGIKVRLPAPHRAGVKLLGARGHQLYGRPVAQTHYLKDGTRVVLNQIHAPRYGLSGLTEVTSGGQTFFVKDCGAYRLVVWRADDNIMALVSPLAMREALLLGDAMRDTSSTLA